MTKSKTHALPDVAFRKLVAAVGTPGAGKSYNLCEQMVIPKLERREQVVIIDPTGAWFGVTLKPDGKRPSGHDIAIFGGDHGSMMLTPNMGRAVGELLGKEPISAVLDLSNMELSEQIHFMSEWAVSILLHNKKPITVVIDEADEFLPQVSMEKGELSVCKGRVKRLITRGRKRGFRPVILTQRPQAVDKGAFNMVQVLIALQCSGHHERKQIEEYVKANGDPSAVGEMLKTLPELEVGEAWVWAPRDRFLERMKFGRLSVYDSFKEEDEEGGFEGTVPVNDASLGGIKAALAEFENQRKANDPKVLKARVADLEKQLRAKAPAAAPAPVKTDTRADLAEIKQKKFDEGVAAGQRQAERQIKALKGLVAKGIEAMQRKLSSILTQMARHAKAIEDGLAALRGAAAEIEGATGMKFPELEAELEKMASVITAGAPIPAPTEKAAAVPRAEKRASAPPPTGDAPEGVSQRHKAVLDAIAWWAAAGIEAPSRVQVAGKCGHNAGGGYFRDLLGKLSGIGLIAYPKPGTVQLTDAGRAAAPAYEMATQDELHRAVEDSLEARHWAMLKVLIEAYPNEISRADLAAACGKDAGGGYFRDLVGKLSGLEMVTYPRQGAVKAADWLFI